MKVALPGPVTEMYSWYGIVVADAKLRIKRPSLQSNEQLAAGVPERLLPRFVHCYDVASRQ